MSRSTLKIFRLRRALFTKIHNRFLHLMGAGPRVLGAVCRGSGTSGRSHSHIPAFYIFISGFATCGCPGRVVACARRLIRRDRVGARARKSRRLCIAEGLMNLYTCSVSRSSHTATQDHFWMVKLYGRLCGSHTYEKKRLMAYVALKWHMSIKPPRLKWYPTLNIHQT